VDSKQTSQAGYEGGAAEFLFNQPNACQRLSLARIFLAVICLVQVLFGAYDRFYAETSEILFSPGFPFYFFPPLGKGFYLLKAVTILSAVALGLGLKTRSANVVLAGSFLLLNFYVSYFGASTWSYNTHLNFFLIALCFADSSRHYSLDKLLNRPRRAALRPVGQETASFVLSFMQIYVAVLYLQSGVSKLLYGGMGWYLGGQTLFVFTIRGGTSFGLYLAQYPWVFKLLAVGTGIFEFGFFFLCFYRKAHKLLAVAATVFHLSVWLTMGISFWFLWLLLPALFWLKSGEPTPRPLLSRQG